MSISQPGDVTIIAPGSVPSDASPFTRAESVLGGFVALPSGSGPPTTTTIPASSRRVGMLAYTPVDTKFWQLIGGTADINWVQASFGAVDIAEVACAATGNLTLSGEQTIDGVTTSGSRVLVPFQTTSTQNGIYVSASGAWTRSTDQDTSAEFRQGVFFRIAGGTVNGGKFAAYNGAAAPTVGTTAISYRLDFATPVTTTDDYKLAGALGGTVVYGLKEGHLLSSSVDAVAARFMGLKSRAGAAQAALDALADFVAQGFDGAAVYDAAFLRFVADQAGGTGKRTRIEAWAHDGNALRKITTTLLAVAATTDATVTTVLTIPIPTSTMMSFGVRWHGRDASNNEVLRESTFVVRRVGSASPVQFGTTNDGFATTKDDAAAGTPDFAFSSNNLILRVTGKAATNYTWDVEANWAER